MKLKRILSSILSAMMIFSMSIVTFAKSTTLAPGSYDANWNMIKDWKTLVSEKLVTYGDELYGEDYATWLVGVDSSIEYLVIDGSSVEVIYGAFSGNASSPVEGIKGVKMTDGVKTITYKAFNYATNLKSIELADTVETIEAKAFFGTGLESATMYADINYIDEDYLTDTATFRDSKIKTLVIEEGVTSIPAEMFRDCKELENVVIPASVTSIGDRAFYDCLSLKSITILGTGVSIGAQVFDKNNTSTSEYGNCAVTINAADSNVAKAISDTLNGNGKSVTTIQAIMATVNGEYYATLKEACTAANDGDTVTLLNNVALSGQNCADMLSGKIVDLNGNTLTLEGNTYLTKETTIKNGNIIVTGAITDSYLCLYTADTKLTLDTVSITGTFDAYAVLNGAEGSTLIIKNSSIDVTGNISSPDDMGNIIYGGNVTVDSSTIKGNNTVRGIGFSNITVQNGSSIEISDVETGFNCASVSLDNSTATITNATKRAVRLNNDTLTLNNNSTLTTTNCTEDIIGIGTEGNDKISVDTTSTLNANVADNIIDNSPIAPTVTVKSLAEYLIDYMPIASYPENTTLYRLGLYAAAESDTYENYGFEVSVDGANPANIEATKYGSAINVVVGDETKEISASGLNYDSSNNTCVFGQIISFPAEYNGANRITFRPYVVENGEYKYGYTFTLPMLYTK